MAQLKDLIVSGAARFLNGIDVVGDLTLAGNLLPATSNTYDLGNPSYHWRYGYVNKLGINSGGSNMKDISEALYVSGTTHLTDKLTADTNVYIKGNLGVGGENNNYKLYVNGTSYFTGPIRIGNDANGDNNYIAFYGTNGDGPGSFTHTYIGENRYGDSESSELFLFKGNDQGSNTNVAAVAGSGPDRIRHLAAGHLFQVYRSALSGTFKNVAASGAASNVFEINGAGVLVSGSADANNGTKKSILGIYGTTYGNTASHMKSGVAGVFSYGDGGPQIDFGVNPHSPDQQGALIFTDNDQAGDGVSWHFVSNQSDWNVNSKRFVARSSITIGYDKPQTGYALQVNGNSYFTGGNILLNGNLLPDKDRTYDIGSKTARWRDIYTNSLRLQGPSNNGTWDNGTTPRIEFTYDDGANRPQPVYFGYTSTDAYRGPYGLKIWGTDGADPHAWLEVEGTIYARTRAESATTGAFSTPMTTTTYLAGNQGRAIINSTAGTGYTMLARMKSTDGVYTHGVYNGAYELHYTVDSTITAGTNGYTHGISLMNQNGLTELKNLVVDNNNHTNSTTAVGNGAVYIYKNVGGHANLQSGQLVVGSTNAAYNSGVSGQNVAIELWRGGNASWQLLNTGGVLKFRNNYVSAIQSSYSQNSLWLNYNSGAGSIPYLAIGQTDFNTTYRLQVNGNAHISKDATIDGSIRNLAVDGGIYWNPYVESATDASDAASIRVIKAGIAGGTELQIKQANDQADVINLVAPYYIYLNSKQAFNVYDSWLRINNGGGFTSGVYFGSSITRTDNQFQVGGNGANFYASTARTYVQSHLAVGAVNDGYSLYVNSGQSWFKGLVWTRDLKPEANNAYTLGDDNYKWKAITAYHGKFAGTSTTDTNANALYGTGGLEVRESNYSTTNVSDFKCAPRIGFHWGGRVASSLSFHTDGIFYFRKQDGASRATIDANVQGNAASATKLATTRTITVSNAVSATAKSFDGTANIDIPIDSVKEAYLTWGGKHFNGTFGPIDAGLNEVLGANRFAFFKPNSITVEYSRDSGSTWIAYGDDNNQKLALTSSGAGYMIGKADSTNKAVAAYQLRITFDQSGSGLYSQLNKIMLYVSTEGSTGCTCTIDQALNSDAATYTNLVKDIAISGWSGWNVINIPQIIFGGKSSQTRKLRFTFKNTGGSTQYNGLIVSKIYAYGGVGWSTPSNLALTGHLYSYNASGDATFPGKITATKFNGDATSVNGVIPTWAGSLSTSNYVAAWTNDGKKIQAMSWANVKTMLGLSSDYVKKSGDIMTGNLNWNGKGTNYIGNGGNDISPTVGGALGNLVISSWWGVSFTTSCDSQTYSNTTAVSIDCRNGLLRASKVYGAVWNDYAEFRMTKKDIQPGRVIIETGKGDLILSTKRLQAGVNVVSDTYGFAIGETEKTKTPIAVSGRALVYPYEDRETYKPGEAVCSGPDGTVSRMTREEIMKYPERIVGTVSEIPSYETWGTDNVKVNGRIWIKVK